MLKLGEKKCLKQKIAEMFKIPMTFSEVVEKCRGKSIMFGAYRPPALVVTRREAAMLIRWEQEGGEKDNDVNRKWLHLLLRKTVHKKTPHRSPLFVQSTMREQVVFITLVFLIRVLFIVPCCMCVSCLSEQCDWSEVQNSVSFLANERTTLTF